MFLWGWDARFVTGTERNAVDFNSYLYLPHKLTSAKTASWLCVSLVFSVIPQNKKIKIKITTIQYTVDTVVHVKVWNLRKERK